MLDEETFYRCIGDVLAAAQGEAVRAVPFGSDPPSIEVGLVDLVTAIVLEPDILHSLVDGRGRPPHVQALRARRRSAPKVPPDARLSAHGAHLVRSARPSAEVTLSAPLRDALDASRARFAQIDATDRATFAEMAFARDPGSLAALRRADAVTGGGSHHPVEPQWPVLLDLFDRASEAAGADVQPALADMEVDVYDVRAAIVSVGLRLGD